MVPGPLKLAKKLRLRSVGKWQQSQVAELTVDVVEQFPPEPLRGFGPKQYVEAAVLKADPGAPFVLHAAEPPQIFEKPIAERGFKPGEIFPIDE
jgi:hypothetical protein